MGMLPIALAICGFVLLWAIVNYNSLLARKAQVQHLMEKKGALLNLYHSLLGETEILFAKNNFDGSVYLKQLKANRQQDASLIMEQLIQAIAAMPGLQASQVLLLKLKETNQQLVLIQRKLLHRMLEYNNMVSKMPSRIVAILFGFKSFLPG